MNYGKTLLGLSVFAIILLLLTELGCPHQYPKGYESLFQALDRGEFHSVFDIRPRPDQIHWSAKNEYKDIYSCLCVISYRTNVGRLMIELDGRCRLIGYYFRSND